MNFNNKIWNATRFVRMHLRSASCPHSAGGRGPQRRSLDRALLRVGQGVTASLEEFDFDKAARAIYDSCGRNLRLVSLAR